MHFLKNIVSSSILLLIFGCQSQHEYISKPTKSIVNSENDLLEVNAVAYHESDSLTRLFLEIVNENLLYKYNDTSLSPYAEIKVFYKLIDRDNLKHVTDSGSVVLRDRSPGEKLELRSIYADVKLQAKIGHAYVLEVHTFDLNKKIQYLKQMEIIKLNHYSEQNFLITQNGKISFRPYFAGSDRVKIKFNSNRYFSIRIDCFLKDFPIALPPFSNKEKQDLMLEPDSSFNLSLSSDELDLDLPKQGFYHLRLDQKSNEGLTLFTFNKSYPGVSSAEEMINCTRYIMTKEEFTSCKDARDKKEAIDKFWLEIGGSHERAKELLKRYYNRVKEANKYYNGYTQGWKSDRGMIFIVFGQASNVLYREDEEVWIYGSPVNQSTTTFVFKKIENPYSSNVYILERSQFYKPAWSNAVDQWRQGIYYEGRR